MGESVVNILDEIISVKRARVAEAMRVRPLDQLRETVRLRGLPVSPMALSRAINTNGGTSVIAEFKRRSPSKGMIRPGADPATVARWYEAGGAAAISVLTEQDFFDGSLADLQAIRETASLPLLRKDFIFDEYQIYETAIAGADAILLIAAALDDESLRRLRMLAEEQLGLDALVEVHTREEMRRAVNCGAKLIGVNNRDLTTFAVSLDTSIELAHEAPPDCALVSESGLENACDLYRLGQLGYKGFLIGESLMRAEKPEEALRRLLKATHSHASESE